MLPRVLLLFALIFLFCEAGSQASPETEKNRAKLRNLRAQIQAVYGQENHEKAVPLFQQMILLMKKEYGENDESVGVAQRNFAYLLSSLNRKKEAAVQADQASRILLARGKEAVVGNTRLGKYSLRCPANYEAKCRGGVDDDQSWVSSYEFFDAPVKSGQQYTFRVEVFEYRKDLPGHFRYANLNDYLNGCYADNEVLKMAGKIDLDGITFDRAVVDTITPGDYRESPSRQMGTIYFARHGKNVIIMQCRSPEGGFPITLALVEPAFLTFHKHK